MPRLDVLVAWRPGAPDEPALRRRVEQELASLSWALSELQLAVHDANQRVGLAHAWLLPRMELRLPLYDLGVRYRLVLSELDRSAIHLVDGDGTRLADVRVV